MKKSLLIVAVAGVLLLLTNPGIAAHRAAVVEKQYTELYLGSNPKLKSGPYSRFAVEANATQSVERINLGLFSLTKYHFLFNGREISDKILGVGILGQVYLWTAS